MNIINTDIPNVHKDYDKDYTTHKYINFSFENLTKTKQSITYHAYLNNDLSRIIRASIKSYKKYLGGFNIKF